MFRHSSQIHPVPDRSRDRADDPDLRLIFLEDLSLLDMEFQITPHTGYLFRMKVQTAAGKDLLQSLPVFRSQMSDILLVDFLRDPIVQQPKLLDSSQRNAPTRSGIRRPSSFAHFITISPAITPATPS